MFVINSINKTRLVVNLIIATILLYLFRTAIPFFKYPFVILYFSLLIYCSIKYNIRIISSLRDLFQNYFIIFFLIVILVIAFLISKKYYLVIFKDVINAIILVSIFYLLHISIITRNLLNIFIINLIRFIIVLGLFIAIIGFIRFYFLITGVEPIFKFIGIAPSPDESIHIDYNFALLPIFFGTIGVLYLMNTPQSVIHKIIYNIILVIFTLNIFLSGSRRGLIIFLVGILFLFVIQIITIFSKNNYFLKISKVSRCYLLSLSALIFIFYFIVFHASYEFKNNCLEALRIKDINIAKNEITSIFYSYISIIDKNPSYKDIHKKIWSHGFYPSDPDSGWGNRTHKTIYPLYGNNVQIVPEGSKGYLVDKTCEVTSWSGHAFSITIIGNESVNIGDSVAFSAYCYVSENFNGTWVQISYKSEEIPAKRKRYDLNQKGEWQKLSINQVIKKEGLIYFYLYFSQYNNTNFNSLNGYVIFAHPEFEVIKAEKDLESYIITPNVYLKSDILFRNKLELNSILYKSWENKNELEIIDSHPKTKLKRLDYLQRLSNHDSKIKYYASLLNIKLKYLTTLLFTTSDRDPIRKLVADLISEDTTYYGYKAEIKIDTITNLFLGGRLNRWQFGWQIFTKEYNWVKKIFGGGFAHLNWYGYFFYGDKTKSDWPHNPFISVLLYSGVFGLLIYIFFIYKVVYYYIRYYREYQILFIYFLLTSFFTFFSGDSPFDPPMMGFFVMFPFFINYIHKKQEAE